MTGPLLMTVQITGDFTGSPLRWVNDLTPVTVGGHEYTPVPFTLTLPNVSGYVRIDADVPRELVDALRAMASPPHVDVAIVATGTPDTIQVVHRCTLVKVRPTRHGVSALLVESAA